MLPLIELLDEANKMTMKIAPEKNFLTLLTVKYLGFEIDFNTYKPNQSKTAATQKILSQTTKIELMKFIGSLSFYSKYMDRLHVNMKPLYDSLHDSIKILWNIELETLFQQIKASITKDVTPTLPNTNHPFSNTEDSSLIGIGCVLFQMNDERKLDIISFKSPKYQVIGLYPIFLKFQLLMNQNSVLHIAN